MKLLSLAFRRFGPFDERVLDFPDDGRNLHVIHGPNEAGKSTALVGLRYFLFGFPHGVAHDFRFRHQEQRIAATLVDVAGRTISAHRRRGRNNTLRDADDRNALPDDCLRAALGGLDEAQFEMLFGINHAQLVLGGEGIAKGQGSLGQALFEAGTGLAGLGRIDKRLAERLDFLFKRAGQNQAIAVALRELKEERALLKSETVAIDAWLVERDKLEAAVAAKKSLEAERDALKTEERRLTSYSAAVPTLKAMAQLEERLRPLADARLLPADFAENHRLALESLKSAELLRDRHREACDAAAGALERLPIESQILAEESAIAELGKEIGGIAKADKDRPALYARMREHQGEARQTLLACFKKSDLAEAESLRVSQAEQERIRTLGEARAARTEAVETHRNAVNDLDAQIADLERQLAEAPAPGDAGPLEALDRELVALGDLEAAKSRRADEFRAEYEAIEAELAGLAPYWKGPLKAVRSLHPPSSERIADYVTLLKTIDAEIREAEKARDGHAKAIRERARQIDALEAAGHVPDEAELHAARQKRDRSIDALASSPLGADAARIEVRVCDDLADRMRREANRVSEIALLQTAIRSDREEQSAVAAELEALSRKRADLLTRWAADWQPTGIAPGEPSAMRDWFDRWASLKERVEALEAAGRTVKAIATDIETHKSRVRTILGDATIDPGETLLNLRDRLKSTIDAGRGAREARAVLENSLRGAKARREAAVRHLADAETKLAEWTAEWGRAVAVLGLGAGDEPSTANRYLGDLGRILGELREAETIDLRLKGIDRDRSSFLERLRALRERLDGDRAAPLDPDKLDVAVDELVRRVNDAKVRRRERDNLEKDLSKARSALDQAEEDVVISRSRLQALCEQAGLAAADDLPEAISRSDRRRELEARLDEERVRLDHHAGDVDRSTFATEAAAARPTIDARLPEIRDRLAAIDRAIPEQAIAARAAEEQIERWQRATSAAADRQQAIESLLARLNELIADFAAVHLARESLRLTIERFRERRHDSLLSQAERYFAKLTCGAFRRLEVEEPEPGKAILVARRSAPDERVEISGLSDGTRDQLFLALRLAGIEQHIRVHGPMPVVVDDVLVNFDESREAATVQCLADLSRETQVFVFTHHNHVVETARRIAPDAVRCHDLS